VLFCWAVAARVMVWRRFYVLCSPYFAISARAKSIAQSRGTPFPSSRRAGADRPGSDAENASAAASEGARHATDRMSTRSALPGKRAIALQ
jgi:hypothetical protein